MARSRKTKARGRASINHAQCAADALFAYWRAGIARDIAARSKRKPSDAKVSAALASISKDDLVSPLLRKLREWERRLGKLASAWSAEEKRQASIFAATVLDEMRTTVFQRPPGRPTKRPPARGIINSEISKPSKGTRRGVREAKKLDLIRFAAFNRLGAYARKRADQYRKVGGPLGGLGSVSEQEALKLFGSLKVAKQTFRSWKTDPHTIERADSSRRGAQAYIEAAGLPKGHEERIRKRIERMRPEILAAIEKLLKQ